MMLPIKGFIENSLVEWEGKITSVIFLPTCNFLCPYCHAPHLVKTPNELESIPLEAVVEKIRKSSGWIDGVVISGGEPTLHKRLDELLALFKDMEILTRLDTNGTNPSVLENLLSEGLLDCIAMDIKAPLRKEIYERVAGIPCNIDDIQESICTIMESGIEYEFRTTVCPTQLTEENIVDIVKAIKGAKRYIIQSFKPNHCLDKRMLTVLPYPIETLREFALIAREYVDYCCVRGEEGKILLRN
ncbi:MAG: anaerobic ribonucleoside-triphosphate reductase activating protein [Candidatus Brocadiaceae bacterium]|nr:anaerobic ribonucleoside-triphosphate reductase activating protein [Candidatus Brocadiaceae bacterium]